MQYRIKSLRVNNFKCFDDSKFYEFSFDEEKNPIILTGPNGFGKTTFFDALELIFSKNITRFETKIENKNTNLLKNVLLNKAEQDGYIVVTLVNKNKEYITLMAKIDHTKKKVVYSDSINFGIEERYIETQRLNDVLNEFDDWKENLTDFDRIKYNMN
ncbi:AAA family ATPase, partial [Faecalibacillus faecis]|uniref:AAA family ATPase n=1 Tax=Faecalibacillus faecis TaxID=1982628 RepID=UPI00386B8732